MVCTKNHYIFVPTKFHHYYSFICIIINYLYYFILITEHVTVHYGTPEDSNIISEYGPKKETEPLRT